MRGPAASFLARRMGSSALLLGNVLLAAFIAASLVSALATFDARALPVAAHRQLASEPGMSVVVIGLLDAKTAESDTAAIGAAMRRALGAVPYRLDEAVWSDPFALTAPGGRTSPQAELAASAGLTANAALTEGTWPTPPGGGQPVPAALPAAVADALHAAPGTVLSLRDRNNGSRLALRVTGVYRQRDPRSPYWGLDGIWTCGASVGNCFTVHGPIAVNAAAFGGTFGPAGIAVDQASWVVRPDLARTDTGSLANLADRVQRAESSLQGPGLGGLLVSGGIPAGLRATASDLAVARSLLASCTLLLLLPAAGALVLAAGLLARHRAEESALLNARGAARWQLVAPALAEAVVISAVAAVAGALAGARLAGLLADRGLLRGAGLRLSGGPGPLAAWAALAVVPLCAVITVWPVLRPSRPGAVRARAGRQRTLAAVAEAGGDLALLALAGLAVWELRAYSGAAASGIDPVLALAPALALAGVSLIPLRALPVLARGLNRFAAGSRRLGAALAGWEISRRPVRQAGPVLLAVLAVATGTLTFAEYQSWRQSAQDQAAFSTGADVRVDLQDPVSLGRTAALFPGAMAVTDVPSAAGASGGGAGDLIAVDARAAPATVLLRPDLSPVPAAALWRKITSPRRQGVMLPGRPARLEITASLGRGTTQASVALSVQDASGAVYSVPAGSLPADGRPHGLVATLSATGQARYPLRLLGLSLGYAVPSGAARPVTLTIGVGGGVALAGWRPALSTSAGLPARSRPAIAGWRTAGDTQQLVFFPGRTTSVVTGTLTIAAPAGGGVIPAIATRAFLRDNQAAVGSVVSVSAGPATVPVRVVAEVTQFPTVTGDALIVDQAAVQGLLASRSDPPLPVTSWWLSRSGGTVPRGLPPGASVTDRAGQASALLGDALSATPQQAGLAVAGAAVLLAVLGFAVSVTASMRARRTQTALLAALGVPRATQAGHLCLEELLLSLPAAATGLLAGIGLAHLLVPAVTLTPAATAPVPPVLVQIPVGWVAALAAAVAVLPVLAAAATVGRRPEAAARLRVVEAA